MIKEVRGQGLMVGIEFHDFSQTLPIGLRQMISVLDDKLKGSLCGFVGSLLLRHYGILVAFTEYNRNVIRLEPPLIVQRDPRRHVRRRSGRPARARHHPHRHRLPAHRARELTAVFRSYARIRRRRAMSEPSRRFGSTRASTARNAPRRGYIARKPSAESSASLAR